MGGHSYYREANAWRQNANGITLLSPIGECIVLGPKGQNVDVVAHEYTQAEVYFRLGW